MRYWEPPKKRRAARHKKTATAKPSIASPGNIRQYPFLRKFYRHQAVVSVGLQKFIFFLVLATLLYAFVVGDAGVVRIMSLRGERADLVRDIAQLDTDIASLDHEIDRLDNDPAAMEKLGRERYGYIYPGDRVYKIVHPTP